jgi:hypothetical protein
LLVPCLVFRFIGPSAFSCRFNFAAAGYFSSSIFF